MPGALGLYLIITGFLTVATPQERTLIILPFDAATKSQAHLELREGIPDIFSSCFTAHSSSITLLDRSHLGAIINELGLNYDAPMAKESAVKIGHFSSARYIMTGSFMVNNGDLEIQALLYETETMRLVGTAESQGKLNDIIDNCAGFVRQILAKLDKGKKEFSPAKGNDTMPEVNRNMIEGLGFFYNGEFWKAFPAFLKVLEKDPGHGLAKFWLGKSYFAAGMPDLARVSLDEFMVQFPKHGKLKEAKRLLQEVNRHE